MPQRASASLMFGARAKQKNEQPRQRDALPPSRGATTEAGPARWNGRDAQQERRLAPAIQGAQGAAGDGGDRNAASACAASRDGLSDSTALTSNDSSVTHAQPQRQDNAARPSKKKPLQHGTAGRPTPNSWLRSLAFMSHVRVRVLACTLNVCRTIWHRCRILA